MQGQEERARAYLQQSLLGGDRLPEASSTQRFTPICMPGGTLHLTRRQAAAEREREGESIRTIAQLQLPVQYSGSAPLAGPGLAFPPRLHHTNPKTFPDLVFSAAGAGHGGNPARRNCNIR